MIYIAIVCFILLCVLIYMYISVRNERLSQENIQDTTLRVLKDIRAIALFFFLFNILIGLTLLWQLT